MLIIPWSKCCNHLPYFMILGILLVLGESSKAPSPYTLFHNFSDYSCSNNYRRYDVWVLDLSFQEWPCMALAQKVDMVATSLWLKPTQHTQRVSGSSIVHLLPPTWLFGPHLTDALGYSEQCLSVQSIFWDTILHSHMPYAQSKKCGPRAAPNGIIKIWLDRAFLTWGRFRARLLY